MSKKKNSFKSRVDSFTRKCLKQANGNATKANDKISHAVMEIEFNPQQYKLRKNIKSDKDLEKRRKFLEEVQNILYPKCIEEMKERLKKEEVKYKRKKHLYFYVEKR